MTKLHYSPIVGSSIPLNITFRDSHGKMYVPSEAKYTILALNNDRQNWTVVNNQYNIPLPKQSSINLTIKSDSTQLITGTNLQRKVMITWSTLVEGQETSFNDEIEFELKPYPTISSESIPPAPPAPTPQLEEPTKEIITTIVEDKINIVLKLTFDFAIRVSELTEDTFLIDDEVAEYTMNESMNIVTFDISDIDDGEHKLSVGTIESISGGVLQPFEYEFRKFNLIGNTDISEIADGTITGAIKLLYDKLFPAEEIEDDDTQEPPATGDDEDLNP